MAKYPTDKTEYLKQSSDLRNVKASSQGPFISNKVTIKLIT